MIRIYHHFPIKTVLFRQLLENFSISIIHQLPYATTMAARLHLSSTKQAFSQNIQLILSNHTVIYNTYHDILSQNRIKDVENFLDSPLQMPILSKIFEKLLLKRILPIVTDANILPNSQFGFHNSHSTVHPVHRLVDKISYSLEEKLLYWNLPRCIPSIRNSMQVWSIN